MADTITLKMTEQNILFGIPNDPCNCPVAMNIKDRYGIDVNSNVVKVGNEDVWIEGELYKPVGDMLSDFINAYDNNCVVDESGIQLPQEYEWILTAEIELRKVDTSL